MAPRSPMKALKRRASDAGGEAKRRRNLVPTVVNAIAGSEAVAGDLRSLLKTTLPIVLKANKEDRHEYEAAVVEEAAKALKAVQADLEQSQAAALAKQNEVISQAEETKRKNAKEQAAAHLEAMKAKYVANKETEKACENAEEDAEDALKKATRDGSDAIKTATKNGHNAIAAAQREHQAADKELQKYIDKHATLSGVLANEFALLQEGTGASAEGRKALSKLMALGKEYHLDSTLLQTLPTSCKKQAAARTEFEALVFTNLQGLINGVINELAGKVAEAEPIKTSTANAVSTAQAECAAALASAESAKAAAVATAQGVLEQAKADLAAATDELNKTNDARAEAAKDLQKADAHLRHIWEDMRRACDAQDNATEEVKNMKENIWVAFEQLKEKQPEPEPVDEPEPMELAAAETAPTEGEAPVGA